jgi:hypothetical protein
MVFQLKARVVSKEDEKKLYKKYSKQLKDFQADKIEAVCKFPEFQGICAPLHF